MAHGIGNPVSGLGQTHKKCGVKKCYIIACCMKRCYMCIVNNVRNLISINMALIAIYILEE